jgi:hypothetical protein
LRRTVASGLQRIGIRHEVIERLMNHVSGLYSGVAGIYQRDPLTEEVAAALLRWSHHVAGLVDGGDNVCRSIGATADEQASQNRGASGHQATRI